MHCTFAVMEEQYMRRALELAQRGAGSTAPNPMVGAVLVHEGRIIGEGWHRQYGEAHAEVNCLDSIAPADRSLIAQSTMYVSLEPCAHWGRTPPCAGRLVQEKVREVVIANIDPFEKVSGSGIRILEDAGIVVRSGVLGEAGSWLNRRFFCFHRQQRPYVILKWAESANGFIAPADLARTQLSNDFSSDLVHRWRTEEAAILVGYRTALYDNPQLTARSYPGRQPLRIALDRDLQLPGTHHLLDGTTPTRIVTGREQAADGNTTFVRLDFGERLLPGLLEHLHRDSRLSLIVEGGAALLNSFIAAGLWDEARIFKTKAQLSDGIAAPLLAHGRLEAELPVAGDTLQLWSRDGSPYRYPGAGAPL